MTPVKLGNRDCDPVVEITADVLYKAAVDFGASDVTAAKLLEAVMTAEEEQKGDEG